MIDLINPEDIVLLNDESLAARLPKYLVKLVRQYSFLEKTYPELIPYALRDEPVPLKSLE